MKKLLLTLLFIAFISVSKGQTILVSADFDNYDGTTATIPAGFFISWNSTSSPSYYTGSSTSCGIACNAYKFGVDSSTIITPSFANADSVRFMMKGNGINKPNKFKVYGSGDSSNWVLIHSYDSISLAKVYYTLPVGAGYTNLMFYYEKDSSGLNVGFDDLYIYQGTISIGITEKAPSGVSVFPSPTNGPVNIEVKNSTLHGVRITVTNILGKEMKTFSYAEMTNRNTIDLSSLEEGIYMIRIKADKTDILQRVLVRK
jgi:hypothetical protein